MNEDEERLIRVTLGMLARQLRELITYVGAINAAVKSGTGGDNRAFLEDIEKGILELEASVLRVAEALPPEAPGSGNGQRLH